MNSVIIGANFGDEGKGLITDFEARRLDAKINVRFNGGAQAGHTVISNGMRHVFGHIGASTFTNTDTYLSGDFIINPLILKTELKTINDLGFYPRIFAHVNCRVTTIFDMALNTLAELTRSKNGSGKHGSCGMGINETVTRHDSNFTLTLHDLLYLKQRDVHNKVYQIWSSWVPHRLRHLNIDIDSAPEFISMIIKYPNINQITEDLISIAKNFVPVDRFPKNSYSSVVFEGAQGLMLDEFLGEFPHVTRSITGLQNAITAAEEMNISDVKPIYVTRAYLTRHGAGPLQNEGVKFCEVMPQDQTNVFNPHQDHIRYAPLDLIALRDFILADLERILMCGIKIVQPTIAVTCLDQVGDEVTVAIKDGELITIKTTELCDLIEKIVGLKVSHRSYGPTASDVVFTKTIGV